MQCGKDAGRTHGSVLGIRASLSQEALIGSSETAGPPEAGHSTRGCGAALVGVRCTAHCRLQWRRCTVQRTPPTGHCVISVLVCDAWIRGRMRLGAVQSLQRQPGTCTSCKHLFEPGLHPRSTPPPAHSYSPSRGPGLAAGGMCTAGEAKCAAGWVKGRRGVAVLRSSRAVSQGCEQSEASGKPGRPASCLCALQLRRTPALPLARLKRNETSSFC